MCVRNIDLAPMCEPAPFITLQQVGQLPAGRRRWPDFTSLPLHLFPSSSHRLITLMITLFMVSLSQGGGSPHTHCTKPVCTKKNRRNGLWRVFSRSSLLKVKGSRLIGFKISIMLIAYLGARPESLWSESFCIHSFPLGEKKKTSQRQRGGSVRFLIF